jgi:hypothetical protein
LPEVIEKMPLLSDYLPKNTSAYAKARVREGIGRGIMGWRCERMGEKIWVIH